MIDTALQERVTKNSWKMFAHSLAMKASGGAWRCGPAHEYLSIRLAFLMACGNARVVIHMPPGHGKSTFLSHYVPLQRWELYPNRKIGFATHSDNYSAYWGKKLIAAMRSNNPYITTRLLGNRGSASEFATTAGGEWTARGVGASIMGRRFDDLILDDPIGNADQAFSKKERTRLLSWYDGVADSRMEPDANIILLMQRWHENDLSGELVKRGYTYICFPAIAEKADVLGRKPGDALWPHKWSIDRLIKKRDGDPKADPPIRGLSEYFWGAQWQGNPTPLGGRLIKTEWLRRWKVLPERFDEECIFADLNMKDDEQSLAKDPEKIDYSVFQYWGRRGSAYYLIDQVRGVMGITEQVETFARFCKKHPGCTTKGIEDKANGPALVDLVKRKVPGVIPMNPRGGKTIRVMACEGVFKAGNVLIPADERENPWVPQLVEECRVFSGGDQNEHDDQVDTMSLALIHFQGQEGTDLSVFLSGWGGRD